MAAILEYPHAKIGKTRLGPFSFYAGFALSWMRRVQMVLTRCQPSFVDRKRLILCASFRKTDFSGLGVGFWTPHVFGAHSAMTELRVHLSSGGVDIRLARLIHV
jgi:hypothetical protein